MKITICKNVDTNKYSLRNENQKYWTGEETNLWIESYEATEDLVIWETKSVQQVEKKKIELIIRAKGIIKIYLFKEYDKKKRQTVESYFVTEAARDKRLKEREEFTSTYFFEKETLTLPRDIHKLNKYWNYVILDKLDAKLIEHKNQLIAIEAAIKDIIPKCND